MKLLGTEYTAKETRAFLEKQSIILYHTSSELKGKLSWTLYMKEILYIGRGLILINIRYFCII